MNSMTKWLGPGAIVGGLGAAMLCGAGLASADTDADSGPGERASRVSASSYDDGNTARKARSGPARAASVRVADSQAPVSDALTVPDAPAEARVSRARVSSAVTAPVLDNEAPVAAAPRSVAPQPAAAIPATVLAAQSVAPVGFASTPAPAAATATAPIPVVPSSVPIDPAKYAGTYYEQGSVKQFFSFGLVNTKAVYTLKSDGTLGVRNSGNYFFKWGPRSSISGSAVPVNPINTALNVGFGGSTPSAKPPGNYLILDRAPDYNWVIVSDPSGSSGFILTRNQTIDPKSYQELVAKARALGVRGRITPTLQYPA